MAYDASSTHRMLGVIDGLDRPQMFLLDTFFPELVLFDTETIDFDLLDRAQGLAPFVSPYVPGKAEKGRGYETRSYEPAYVKPKNQIDPKLPLKRRPGEAFGGTLSAGERRELAAAQLQADHMVKIMRRKEWMAAQALQTGSVIVTGEDFPAQTISFGRDAGLTLTLSGGARWGETDVSPHDDLDAWCDTVANKSGAAVTDVVLDPKAKALLFADPKFSAALDNRRQDGGVMQLGVQPSGQDMWARYLGNLGGLDYWMYQQPYTDDAGSAAFLMPDNSVILGSRQIEGYQAQGAILDPNSDFQALEFFPRRFIPDDPAIEHLMTQSAPLPVPARPNASMFITVR